MSSTSMNVRTFVATDLHIPVNVSRLIRGPHGIGKSSIIRQLKTAHEARTGLKFKLIDKRLSQLTEGDMLGLPSTSELFGEGVTKFNPPDWYLQACKEPCILFFDEQNRATHEVMQASFQIVLDRKLGEHELHPQTIVYAAVNTGATYSVNDMDPALLDRFWTIDLEPDIDDWLDWARKNKIDMSIIEFINGNKNWLDPPKQADFSAVLPSRRSWERLDASLKSAGVINSPENMLFYSLSMGFIGTEAAIAWQVYARDTFSRVTAEDVLERYLGEKKRSKSVTAQDKVKQMPMDRQASTIDAVAMYVVDRWKPGPEGKGLAEPWDKKHTENLCAFLHDLSDELKLALWSKITEHGIENMDLLRLMHATIATDILAVFNVVLGQEGKSNPVIPDFLQKKLDDDMKKRQEASAAPAE